MQIAFLEEKEFFGLFKDLKKVLRNLPKNFLKVLKKRVKKRKKNNVIFKSQFVNNVKILFH